MNIPLLHTHTHTHTSAGCLYACNKRICFRPLTL